MKNETFCDQLENELKKYKSYEVLYDITFIDSVINTFETYGTFLNDIPIDEQEENIWLISDWIRDYYIRQQMSARQHYPKIDAGKKIRQVERKLADFSKLIDEQFGDILEVLEENSEDLYPKTFIHQLKKISDAQNLALELHDDIHYKKFRLFNRDRFYKITSKQDLLHLLKDINHRCSLNTKQLNIKELVDNLQTISPYNHL